MIKVLMSGTPVYRVSFGKKIYNRLKPKHPFKRVDGKWQQVEGSPLYETRVFVHIEGAKPGEDPLAYAVTRQNPEDKHSPEYARVSALKKLLDAKVSQFSRTERTAIWSAYWNRPKGTTAPTPPSPSGTSAQASRPAAKRSAPAPAPVIGRIAGSPEGHRIVNYVASNVTEVTPKTSLPGWFAPGNDRKH